MRIVLFPAALLASTTALASVAIDGWYASAFGGYTWVPDNLEITRWGLFFDHASYDGGYNAGGRVGYQSAPLRYEAEVTYQYAEVDHFDIDRVRQVKTNGNMNDLYAMANIYYDFPEIVPSFAPFVGGGIGYAHVQTAFNGNGPFYITRLNGSDNVFAYQGTVGFTFNFCEAWAANLAYRYVRTSEANNIGKIIESNLGGLGIVYRFDSVRYK